MLRPYVPSGESEDLRGLFLGTAAAAIAAGALVFFAGQYFRLIIVFPLLMGLAAGGAAAWFVERGKVRAPMIAGAVGLLGGLLAWSTDFACQYWTTRQSIDAEVRDLAAQMEQVTGEHVADEAIAGVLDPLLAALGRGEEITGEQIVATFQGEAIPLDDGTLAAPFPPASAPEGFVGFVKFSAFQGTKISRHGQSTQVGATGTTLLWALEILLAAGFGAMVAWGRARQPFCERCGVWYTPAGPGCVVSSHAKRKEALEALSRVDVPALERLGPPGDGHVLVLSARRCPRCATADRYVEVNHLDLASKNPKKKRLASFLLTAAELETVLAVLKKDDPKAQRSPG